jgi:tRNA 2-thiouridine synthesizing protein E
MSAEVLRRSVVVHGRPYQTDPLGYLLDPAEWSRDVALAIADIEGIEMGEEHWTVVDLVRAHYEDRQRVPEARTLLKHMASVLGAERATRKYLHKLFPYGYGPQVCKIAGMTMPRKVMADV